MLGQGLLSGELAAGSGGGVETHPPTAHGPSATGSGALGEPRFVRVDDSTSSEWASLEDRGVRGAVLRWDGGELPLAHALLERVGATRTIAVSEAVHPDCSHKDRPVAFA